MEKKTKKMMTNEMIYKITKWVPIVVASVFFLINLIKSNTAAMLAIGICLVVFLSLFTIADKKQFSMPKKEFMVSLALPTLVFVISLFSGASYSDDFSLFLAVVAISGMFLEPRFTKMQIVLVDLYIVVMYLYHPEKGGGLGQYILCVACFTLAGVLFYQVVKRGKAFIDISNEKAQESEGLLNSIRAMGAELQNDFEASSSKIESGTKELTKGSALIAHGAGEVSNSCNVVQDKIKDTQEQIEQLNQEVKQFEEGLIENQNNVSAMQNQINEVGDLIAESGNVFRTMEDQMNEIAGIAKQISDIAFKLTILSLNAAVESAQAGEFGAGFDVIATEMRELSESSGGFATKVEDVVKDLRKRVSITSEKFNGSEQAFAESKKSMAGLVDSFGKLNKQFEDLYANIENQNRNINQIDYIFDELEHRVSDMNNSSVENKNAVDAIVNAMNDYRDNIDKVIKNTQSN